MELYGELIKPTSTEIPAPLDKDVGMEKMINSNYAGDKLT